MSAVAGLELYMFDSGTLGLQGAEVPVPFFLLLHPDGLVVVDGGNPLAVARDPHAHWGGLADVFEVHMTEAQHCAAQLEAIGVSPGSVSHIVQTHLHIDHTGALGHFPQATVVVHQRELEAARTAESPEASGYVRADYDRSELRWQTVEGETDLFGDGAVRLVETPGHSAGHTSLLLELPETGPVLLTADASDNRDQWEGRAYPRALFSREQAAQSLQRLHALAEQTGALVVFGHDAENWSQLRRAPQSYR
jgi:glyoxylase-like metal-dependent hydrolase (beta-lactamase superfamily II)